MSRAAYQSSSPSAYYWVGENGVVVTDGFDLNDWNWTFDAACRDSDPEAFFNPDSTADRSPLIALCTYCPVRIPCLKHALDYNEQGWWGGMSHTDRRILQRGRDG